jgi:hypothetical protein
MPAELQARLRRCCGAVAGGEFEPAQAVQLAQVLESHRRVIEPENARESHFGARGKAEQ